ncbi:DNA methyltransferase [Oligella sp. HMSC05A10]|uniref:DNA adenine methylase n=1 Tax=Oligella TaxID=90243 RepID=UPI0008A55A4A|nr:MULTISPECIES: DNA adenine methylase [Oligella]OFS84505.1 DNA methyltransferase [Oligella sp. HMSC05A10]
MSRFYTPLRYPGGKGKFTPFIESLIKTNGLRGGHYLEVYAGGAGVALELLFNGTVSDIHINDLDPAIAAFWKASVQYTDDLIAKIREVDITMDNWYHYKAIMEDVDNNDTLEKGFATFFMNRCNRSGILKGGVIGGKAQAGSWKLDARFNKISLIPRFERIKLFKDRIHVYSEDAKDLLQRCEDILPSKNSLIYLDPPYYEKGQGLYRNFYNHQDHIDIKKTLDNIKYPWLVSYDNAPEIRKIYQGYRTQNHILTYTAQEKKLGDEILFFSNELKIPTKGLRQTA